MNAAPTLPARRRWLAAAGALPLAAALPRPATAAEAALAGLLDQRLAQQGVGLAAARIDGPAVELAAAGRRVAGEAGAPDADDLFEIGSLSKTFTALLLADMVVRRELALDDAVEAALPPGLKLRDSAGAPIRWVDLATHRSGLPRLPSNLTPAREADPYAAYDEDALHAFLAAWAPTRPRDASWEYSNLGFGLLGHALARRAGQDFEALLRERVLAPLGLQGMGLSLARPGRSEPTHRLRGHDASAKPVPGWHFQVLAGAGALLGSARHLARYAQAALGLVDHPLAEAFGLVLAPRAGGPGPANPIGLAWILAPLNGRQVATHDGGTFGFTSSIFLDPGRRRAAFVLSNAMLPVSDLALHLLDPAVPLRDLAAEARAAQAAPVVLAPAALAPLAGRYALNPQFKVVVRADGARLFAQASGQGEFELFARSAREFFARVTPLTIRFEGDAGAPPAFELTQAGQRLRFVRE